MRRLRRSVAKYRMKMAGMPHVNSAMSMCWRQFLTAPEKMARKSRRRLGR